MKKLIFNTFRKNNAYLFLFILFTLSLFIWVIQAVNFLDFVSEDGHGFKVYFLYTLLSLPKIISKIFIFVFFITLFLSLLKYEKNNELIIFWNNGISKIEFTNNLIRYSIFFLIIQFFLTSLVVPKTQDLGRSFIRSSDIDFFPSLIKEKRFVDTVENLTIFVEEKKNNGIMNNIFLKENNPNGKSKVIFAKEGKINTSGDNNYLMLDNGYNINFDNNEISSFAFKNSQINLSKFRTKTTITPKIQEIKSTSLIKCLYFHYNNQINLFNYNYKTQTYTKTNFLCEVNFIKNIKEEIFKRMFVPFYIPLITLISCFLIINPKENSNYTYYRNLISIFGIFLIFFSEISYRFVGTNNFYFIFFSLSPLILFIISYIYFLKIQRL